MQPETTNHTFLSVPTVPNRKRRTGTPGAHTLPPSWQPKDSTLGRLAARLRVAPEAILRDYLRPFAEVVRARAFMYRNWDTAFTRSVVYDWAGVRAVAG